MEIVDSSRLVLKQTEESLRALVSQAAAEGDYDAVVKITDWARAVAAVVGDEVSTPEAAPPVQATKPKTNGKKTPRKPSKPPRSRGYPKFFRDDNSLIKVAWSKASKAEYEHRAPVSIVRQLAEALTVASKENELITMDAVLPLHDEEGAEVPSYQSYLTLAWLKDAGLVCQHGRKGYSIKPKTKLKSESVAAFEGLAKRK